MTKQIPNVNINFNGFTCYFSELDGYLNSINWDNIQEGETLYYASSSDRANYDFRIFHIHDGIVEMIAELEGI